MKGLDKCFITKVNDRTVSTMLHFIKNYLTVMSFISNFTSSTEYDMKDRNKNTFDSPVHV